MATTVWRPNEGLEDRHTDPLGRNAYDVGTSRALRMTLARKLVSEILLDQGVSELSDGEWAEFCRTMNADSDELVVSQLVLKAYTIRNAESPRVIAEHNPMPAVEDVPWLPVSAPDEYFPGPQQSPTEAGLWELTQTDPALLLSEPHTRSAFEDDPWVAVPDVASPSNSRSF